MRMRQLKVIQFFYENENLNETVESNLIFLSLMVNPLYSMILNCYGDLNETVKSN